MIIKSKYVIIINSKFTFFGKVNIVMTIFDYYIDDISDKAFEYYVDKTYDLFNFEKIEKKEVRRTDIKEKMNKL